MEIAGKYLGITVRYEVMVAILGWDPPRVARDFTIVGREFIRAAEVFDEKPDVEQVVGFHG